VLEAEHLLLKPFLKKKQIRSKLRNKKSQATVFQFLVLLKFILEENKRKTKST